MIKNKMNYKEIKYLNDKYEKKVNLIASIRLITFIIMLLSYILKHYYYQNINTIIFIITLITFIILILIHSKYHKIYNYYHNYLEIIEEYIKRTNGEWKNFKDTGESFINEKNHFLKDLDIIGKNSLYQLLSIAVTIGGKRKLVKRLSNNNIKNLELEQQAIEELSNNINFCIEYQIILKNYNNENIDLSNELSNLTKSTNINKIDLLIGLILTIINISTLILSITNIININIFYLSFIMNFLINYIYSYIHNIEYKKLNSIYKTYKNIPNLVDVIIKNEFTSKKLSNIKTNLKNNYKEINNIEKFETINNLRNNIISNFILNGISNLNIFILYYFNNFINKNLIKLKENIDDIEELEALISLAGLSFIKENITIPKQTKEIEISFNNIHHPLLDEKQCITNNFNTIEGINIITGSNMGGKTSFLRTIGINIILMNAGSFVCASNFVSNYFKIFTSMRINDDINLGISTFYGELIRIKEMIDYLDKDNMLVLIDEIFKGTNYQDRIYGATKVIEKLNNKKTITLLTTHDFELCDINNIKNYHFKEYYEDNKIYFDYKIREGKCTSTNAKYLMKKLNIIE